MGSGLTLGNIFCFECSHPMPTDDSIAELRISKRPHLVCLDGVYVKIESRTAEENDKSLDVSDDILSQLIGKLSKRRTFSRLDDTKSSVNSYNLVKRVKDKQLSSSSSSLISPAEQVGGKVLT